MHICYTCILRRKIKMTVGIYALWFEQPSLVYIGQSVDIQHRFNTHSSLLNRHEHGNYKLLNAFIEFGGPQYIILDKCQIDDLNKLEVQYIKEFDSFNSGLNLTEGDIEGSWGYNSPRCKASREQLIEAFNLLLDPNNMYEDICEATGITINTLQSIRSQKRHSWLQEEFPEKWSILKNTSSERQSIKQVRRFNKGIRIVISPRGEEHKVINAARFALENNLNKGHFSGMLRGDTHQHKGWTLKKEGSANE